MSVHPISTVVLTVHWLIVAGLSLRVIARRPAVGVALAWLAVNSSAPFVGAVAYLLFGEKRLGRGRAARIAVTLGPVQRWQRDLRILDDAAAVQSEPQNGYLRNSTLVDLETWRNRPAWHKFVENTFRLAGPLL